ncbi:hypothetical protein [Aquimarina algiphila]|uniref:Transglutaminase domain-containing protein n=1 Tax=Aquimarina algiphila TaxID=2047982 RepID=A0A554VC45_9FLAO|nr:hypothetical protein [Aquimarina algiphila]TSE04235.1 hypothetical protein FOF46_26950 [Aquimarina algiphila]
MAQNKLGCFSFPAIIVLAIIGSSFVQTFLPVSSFTSFAIVLLTFSWILGKIQDSNQKKSNWRYMIYSGFVIIFILGIRYAITTIPTFQETQQPEISEDIYREKVLEKGDSIMLLRQKRAWTDNYGNSFEGKFSVREKEYISSKTAYANNSQKHKQQTWGKLYQYLATSDTPKLDLILEELEKIKTKNKLNPFEFAEMVVTFIQDIPYAFVFDTACQSPDKYEDSIRILLEKCKDCCIGRIPFGIQNPVGFMGNLKGDCDTRTVIIYAILSHFGYDVAILNSDYYKHSILGLHIPAKGKFKIKNGKRYYVWETTNKYFTIGTLPKNFDNINHWYFVLTNT